MPETNNLPNDDISLEVIKDFTITGIAFNKHQKPEVSDFQIGYIVGSSGSGKSVLLKEFNTERIHKWEGPVCSNFTSYPQAKNRLLGAGLSSIPAWLKPYEHLSTGQKYRADLAIKMENNAVFDEFTSVLDRNTAKGLSAGIQKFIRENDIKGVVFAGPHRDVIQYLKPDWVFDTDQGQLYQDQDDLIPFMVI